LGSAFICLDDLILHTHAFKKLFSTQVTNLNQSVNLYVNYKQFSVYLLKRNIQRIGAFQTL